LTFKKHEKGEVLNVDLHKRKICFKSDDRSAENKESGHVAMKIVAARQGIS